MSDAKELQDEEREALISIYEGDEAFKQLSPTTFQYKYGKDDEHKSFLVEIIWHENYPMELPNINMDTFFNRNLILNVKEKIKSVLEEEGNQWLGCGMTYTLFECLKDRIDELVKDQPDLVTSIDTLNVDNDDDDTLNRNDNNKTTSNNNVNKKNQKKEQLTKAQKRRQWERTDHKGERPRGWNWVDIVKHLSQTGHKDEGGGSGGSGTTNTSSSNSGYSGAS